MSIFSGIIKNQCLKEYEKELSRQQFSFAQWKALQPAFEMDDRLKSAVILYGDYMRQGAAPGSVQEPVFLPDFSPNRWDYEDYLGRAVYIREDFYRIFPSSRLQQSACPDTAPVRSTRVF